jgi:NitT/TauT family transport system ATP-binding protein
MEVASGSAGGIATEVWPHRTPTRLAGKPACSISEFLHSTAMSSIVVRDLTKVYGGLPVIDPLTLDIQTGSFVTLIGPSGCGKTTLMRVIAGLEPASGGDVEVDGAPPATARSHKRVAMVPQQPGLLPWRTVEANARLLLDVNRRENPEQADDPVALLREVGLGDFLDAYPHELSGGMQQRVALVRALALHAPLLVMDEPFAALDEITRAEMRVILARLVEGRAATVLFITHSIAEAVALSDRVLVSSARPSRIVADIDIDLPRPRTDDVEDDPRFVALCAQVRHALHGGRS